MTVGQPLYDRIGTTYATTRREDPRIAAAIRAAIGDARSVLNVGAGAGAYEPADCDVIALEPSAAMIAQRAGRSENVIQGDAAAIPLDDDSVDVAMAILSDHHWARRADGLREMRRVARDRVVVLNTDPAAVDRFWMTRDYLPGFIDLIPQRHRAPGIWAADLGELLGPASIRTLEIPHDCVDGFYHAFWRRPRAYLDQAVRDNISVFHRLAAAEVADGITRLAGDLADGTWLGRHGDLMSRESLDLGLRLVVASVSRRARV